MSGERKNITQQHYGALIMRPFEIAGNSIHAFYDSDENLVFVLDNTINASKPNVLLVINPESDKKWDEILSNDYAIDLETIRPKQDNKYQKLDIEYSGLNVYDNLIHAFMADDDMEDFLNQLNVLRDSAARHSAMSRLDAANEIISKTNVTIVKTKETIVALQERIKTLRAKLSATKKEIGRVSTKQSAAKILRLESQIEATNEKLKRAQKRLESAQRRLEVATSDAELASNLLNQPAIEIKPSKPLAVAPKYAVQTVEVEEEPEIKEDEPESDIKPLFDSDPNILNEDIAFKPISFDAPVFNSVPNEQNVPVINNEIFAENTKEETPIIESFEPIVFAPEKTEEPKPVLESMTPVLTENSEIIEEEPVAEEETFVAPVVPIAPIEQVEPVMPVLPVEEQPTLPAEPLVSEEYAAPVVKEEPVAEIKAEVETTTSKSSFVYYILLFVLIVLSVFTLWLYQKNMKPTSPVLTAKTEETVVIPQPKPDIKPVKADIEELVVSEEDFDEGNAFFDEEPVVEDPVTEITEDVQEVVEPEEVDEEPIAPQIMNDVPAFVNTSGGQVAEDENVISEEEIIASKPVYEPGVKHDAMFVDEGYDEYSDSDAFYDDAFYDEEEMMYRAEQNM